ncbi:hypothetical protein P691DRAFT_734959 [Macrolepiota fuliginosa MF-IS2]|uniref:Apple domain-containing protein n=1 Tax=Macrolepiota fuliginosa MF-IS2 TaxID=1400762 RepID=A0A9P5X9B4_9AGAR|nr:hypothetical protein P691DRAFT_734959 [Macrolepiota fuliginosa MF-IS2]
MRAFTLVSVAITAILPIAGASIIDFGPTIFAKINKDLTSKNHYGAPIPPWKPGYKPGWYYGPNPGAHPDIPCLGSDVCNWLNYFPGALHCPPKYPPHYPPPPPHHTTTTSKHATTTTKSTSTTPTPTPTPTNGYTPTFQNITSAVQADDFLTFGLVETIEDCEEMCDSVEGCGFVNTYHDVNGKGGSPLLTCALFTNCHGPEDADNAGGQTQPDGSVDFIINSDGWCKVV